MSQHEQLAVGDVHPDASVGQDSNSIRNDKAMAGNEQPLTEPGTSDKNASHIPSEPNGPKNEPQYLPMGFRLYAITIALMLGVFCVSLDNNIIGVAIPRITDEFHSLDDVGWYGSAYLLPGLVGTVTLFSVKWVYLSGLLLFEVGTVVCGAAPNSNALIVGRAIAGVGSSALFIGATLTIAQTVPLEKRPIFLGGIADVYGVASVIGPLLAGAFTERVTWRLCFYINLPIVRKLDPLGNTLFTGGIISLLLALQLGGLVYPFSNGRVIAPLVVFAAALVAFAAIQGLSKDDATVPVRVARQRSVAFFQAIKDNSPVQAGVNFLPFILPEIAFVILSGGLVSGLGYYNPFIIGSSILTAVAAGLCTLLTPDSSRAAWAGYQVLYGVGIGLGFQQGPIIVQTVLPDRDIAVGTGLVLFSQIFGGALFVSVSQNVFGSHLISGLTALNISGLDPQSILASGATNLRSQVSATDLSRVLSVYNAAVMKVFRVGLIVSAISLVGALGVEWKSIKHSAVPETSVDAKTGGEGAKE
ncbi:major facilitator superfamily domain-containing protein [Xylariaceae sp. FL0594]|nr:major facilitator superfamily domain-containing protein [Xylariaceae sp. FL0594]